MIRLLVALTLFATPALAQYYGAPEYGDQNNQQVQQQYNPMEDRWETTKGKKDLKYNAMENEWSYQDRDAEPVYNPIEGKWEYPK